MKIKPLSRMQRVRLQLKQRYFHWWLAPEKVKKTGRLGQLNKHNKNIPSEFVTLAHELEAKYVR